MSDNHKHRKSIENRLARIEQGCVVDAVEHGDEETVLEDLNKAIDQFIR
ncbi:hypothetical protein [Virgibacillus phasianinus]|nr:hypothetical protein [Virgibacillus phasianinus]